MSKGQDISDNLETIGNLLAVLLGIGHIARRCLEGPVSVTFTTANDLIKPSPTAEYD